MKEKDKETQWPRTGRSEFNDYQQMFLHMGLLSSAGRLMGAGLSQVVLLRTVGSLGLIPRFMLDPGPSRKVPRCAVNVDQLSKRGQAKTHK